MKKILIEYLYLDLKTCDRCVGTDAVLDKVVEGLKPALSLAGYQIEYLKMLIYQYILFPQAMLIP